MLFLQSPINPKDWAIVGPVIISIVLLVIIGVYALKELKKIGLISNGNGNSTELIKDITEIKTQLREHERRIGRHQDDSLEDFKIVDARLSNHHDRISKLESDTPRRKSV